jgi:hypothetical protein
MIFANSFPLKALNESSNYYVPYDGLATAIYESNCEWETFKGDEEVIMANMYENWILDRNHTEEEKQVMYEGVLADIWENIKKFFIAIANKIKSWFNSVIKYFKTQFSSDEEFIKKYKDEITDRTEDDDFEFEAHKWDLNKFEDIKKGCKDVFTTIKNQRDEAQDLVKFVEQNSKDTAYGLAAGSKNRIGLPEVTGSGNNKTVTGDISKEFGHRFETQFKEITSSKTKAAKREIDGKIGKIIKTDFSGNLSKAQTALVKLLNGGEKKFCKSFGTGKSLTKEQMIDLVENKTDKLNDIKEITDDIEELAKGTSDYVDQIVGSYTKDADTEKDKTHLSKIVHFYTDLSKYALNYASGVCKTCEEQLREAINESSQILRKFARHKPKSEKEAETESYNRYRRGRTVSLLENWF